MMQYTVRTIYEVRVPASRFVGLGQFLVDFVLELGRRFVLLGRVGEEIHGLGLAICGRVWCCGLGSTGGHV